MVGKRTKQHLGRIKGVAYHDRICFGKYGLRALEPFWITCKQISAFLETIEDHIPRSKGKKWIRVYPEKPVTTKSTGSRMGLGKGYPRYLVAPVKPGRILFELSSVVAEKLARKTLSVVASKMPVPTQFLISE